MKEVNHLFFVDDTSVFYELDERAILNLKCGSMSFQAVFYLNINLTKSDLVRMGDKRNTSRLESHGI